MNPNSSGNAVQWKDIGIFRNPYVGRLFSASGIDWYKCLMHKTSLSFRSFIMILQEGDMSGQFQLVVILTALG